MTGQCEPFTQHNSHPQDVSSLQLSLPPFWSQRQQVWFHHVEARFCRQKIHETTRCCHVASNLPPDLTSELSDVRSAQMGARSYQHLKAMVLERFMSPERARRHLLLTAEDLGDRRPSQLLRSMRHVLDGPEVVAAWTLHRKLFFQSLCQPIRLDLASAGEVTLEHLAELADQVNQATSSSVGAALRPTNPEVSFLEASTMSSPLIRRTPEPLPEDSFASSQ